MIKNNYKKFILVILSFIIGYLFAVFNCRLERWVDRTSSYYKDCLRIFPFSKETVSFHPYIELIFLTASTNKNDWIYLDKMMDFSDIIPFYPQREIYTGGDTFLADLGKLSTAIRFLNLSQEEENAIYKNYFEYQKNNKFGFDMRAHQYANKIFTNAQSIIEKSDSTDGDSEKQIRNLE